MTLKGKRVLVTGAGGFIGSHLTERLVEMGADTTALVRYNSCSNRGWLEQSRHAKNIKFEFGDIVDQSFVRSIVKDQDYVFHLAALIGIPFSYVAPNYYVATNVQGTVNIVEAVRDFGVSRLLTTSTSETYGTARTTPIREDHPMQPQSPYSASKIAADNLAQSFYLSFDTPVTIVRPFNTFGPRQSARAIIPTIISQLLTQDQLSLGSLSPTRDLNYVGNTVDGFIAAALSDKAIGETINFGFGKEISIGDLAQLIMQIMGKKVEIVTEEVRLRPEKSEVFRLISDNSRAKEITGWEPKIGLKEGITKTLIWNKLVNK